MHDSGPRRRQRRGRQQVGTPRRNPLGMLPSTWLSIRPRRRSQRPGRPVGSSGYQRCTGPGGGLPVVPQRRLAADRSPSDRGSRLVAVTALGQCGSQPLYQYPGSGSHPGRHHVPIIGSGVGNSQGLHLARTPCLVRRNGERRPHAQACAFTSRVKGRRYPRLGSRAPAEAARDPKLPRFCEKVTSPAQVSSRPVELLRVLLR